MAHAVSGDVSTSSQAQEVENVERRVQAYYFACKKNGYTNLSANKNLGTTSISLDTRNIKIQTADSPLKTRILQSLQISLREYVVPSHFCRQWSGQTFSMDQCLFTFDDDSSEIFNSESLDRVLPLSLFAKEEVSKRTG